MQESDSRGLCATCDKAITEPWPCKHCALNEFCSEECSQKENYHSSSCIAIGGRPVDDNESDLASVREALSSPHALALFLSLDDIARKHNLLICIRRASSQMCDLIFEPTTARRWCTGSPGQRLIVSLVPMPPGVPKSQEFLVRCRRKTQRVLVLLIKSDPLPSSPILITPLHLVNVSVVASTAKIDTVLEAHLIVKEDAPWMLHCVLLNVLAVGHVESIIPDPACFQCRLKMEQTMLCSRCKQAWYCSTTCQRSAWSSHRKTCIPPK